MAEAYNDASKDSSLKQLNAEGRYFILEKVHTVMLYQTLFWTTRKCR
jgi:hypothetical protein